VRAFLAIPLPDGLCETLAAAGRAIEGLRAQKAATIHLTIRFLGEIADAEADAVTAAAADVTARHAPFDLVLRGLGAFPDARRPRVVWVGLAEGTGPAIALAQDIEAAIVALGLPGEDRTFSPHVTLGRFRDRPRRPPPLDPAREFGRARADRLILYRSTLTPEGARHEAVAELSLGRAK